MTSPLWLPPAMACVLAYFFGCVSGAYYLVRLCTGRDVRTLHSGTAGARNAGRVLGPLGFITVFVIDFTKGALALGVAALLSTSAWVGVVAGVAVVLGHLHPVQLGFRGGKGIVTALGATTVMAPGFTVLVMASAGVLALCTRRITASGLVATAASPLIAVVSGQSRPVTTLVTVFAVLLLHAHRRNIRELLGHAQA